MFTSSEEIGSSAMMNSGSSASARAIETRCLCPRNKPATRMAKARMHLKSAPEKKRSRRHMHALDRKRQNGRRSRATGTVVAVGAGRQAASSARDHLLDAAEALFAKNGYDTSSSRMRKQGLCSAYPVLVSPTFALQRRAYTS